MLLKQSRHGSFSKFGKVGTSATQRALNQINTEQIQGVYINKDSRLKKKTEIQAAHFNLGTDMNMPKMSYGQHLQQQSDDQQNNRTGKNKSEAGANERKKMVENARKSNFNIGELNKMKDKEYACHTSSNGAYKYDAAVANQNKKQTDLMDFKVANFKLGSQNLNYITTNTDEYNNDRIQGCMKQLTSANSVKENAERLNRQKMQQFTYGHDTPNYVSMAKDFGEHDLQATKKLQVKNTMTSKEVKESHFKFGTDQPTYQNVAIDSNKWRSPTPNQRVSQVQKQNQRLSSGKKKNTGKELNAQSNVQISQIGNQMANPFQSLNRQAMEQANKTYVKKSPYMQQDPLSQMIELKKDANKSHMTMGNTVTSYISQAGEHLVQHPITSAQVQQGANDRKFQVDKMRQANFKIRNQKNTQTQQSTYKNWISDQVQIDALGPGTAVLQSNLKQASIKLGGKQDKKLLCMTEASDQFGRPVQINNTQQASDNKDLKTYLKGHHFDFGIKGSKTTQNKTAPFIRTENPGARPGLTFDRSNKEFIKDQQKAHFNLGFDQRPISASNLGLVSKTPVYSNANRMSNAPKQIKTLEQGRQSWQVGQLRTPLPGIGGASRPSTIGPNRQADQQSVASMVERNRVSNICYGKGQSQTGGAFKTSNQALYKWIQPISKNN